MLALRNEYVRVRDAEVIPLIRQQKEDEATTLILGAQAERYEKALLEEAYSNAVAPGAETATSVRTVPVAPGGVPLSPARSDGAWPDGSSPGGRWAPS